MWIIVYAVSYRVHPVIWLESNQNPVYSTLNYSCDLKYFWAQMLHHWHPENLCYVWCQTNPTSLRSWNKESETKNDTKRGADPSSSGKYLLSVLKILISLNICRKICDLNTTWTANLKSFIYRRESLFVHSTLNAVFRVWLTAWFPSNFTLLKMN